MDEVADVLVVGAGAAGGVAALRLARAGLRVLCLEQGGWPDRTWFRGGEPDWELTARKQWAGNPNVRGLPEDYPVDVSGSEMAVVNFNGVGGGTVLYNAVWPRLTPSNFRTRTLDGVADDWPVSYAELQPFYEATDLQFGVSGLGGNPAYPPGADPPLPPLAIGEAGMRLARAHARLGWHWWPDTNAILSAPFGGRQNQCVRRGTCITGCGEGAKASTDLTHWREVERLGGRVITGATVRRLVTDGRGLAAGAEWVDRDGHEHLAAADVVLLAANGVGTPRLLLASAGPGAAEGLANSSGLVGRRLMLHPFVSVTGLFDDGMDSWQGHNGSLIQSMQFYESDPSRGFVRGSKWSLHPSGGPLAASLAQGGCWGAGHHRHVRERLGRGAVWIALCEDLPHEDNRVTLSGAVCDRAGVPVPVLSYRIDENARRMLAWNTDRAAESLREAGAGQVSSAVAAQNGHLLGTARMGDDPATSVVDRWCVSHDVPNLAIVDGSVFVTAGAVNPTSTIAALALRAAEHLLAESSEIPRPQHRRVTAVPGRTAPSAAADAGGGHDLIAGVPPSPGLPLGAVVPASVRAALAAWADSLIPAADGMPSAAEVGVADDLLDRVLTARPDLLAPLRRASAGTCQGLADLAAADPEAHAAVLTAVAGGYYLHPDVRRRIGYQGQEARPVQPADLPAYLAEGLLDHLLDDA